MVSSGQLTVEDRKGDGPLHCSGSASWSVLIVFGGTANSRPMSSAIFHFLPSPNFSIIHLLTDQPFLTSSLFPEANLINGSHSPKNYSNFYIF